MTAPGTSRLKVNPPLGTRPTLEWCRLTDLTIDESYQRSIQIESSQTLIRRIAAFWDWSLCQPLAIARRLDILKVVDGQHRLEAARLRADIDQLPCVIAQYANAGEEAAAFVALNQQRRPLTALDLFKAAVAAEDETALAVLRLLKDNGLFVAPHSNYNHWKPGMVSNISGILRCYRVHGGKATALALEALSRGFHGQVLRYAGTIFPGIYRFIIGTTAQGMAIDRDRLAKALGSFAQKEWKQRIFNERAIDGADQPLAAHRAIASVYAGLAPLPQREPTPSPRPVPPLPKPVELCGGFQGAPWCDQCDQAAGSVKVEHCTDRFCPMKKAAAA